MKIGFYNLTCVTAFHPIPPMHGPSYGPCMGQKGTIMRTTKLHLLSDRSINTSTTVWHSTVVGCMCRLGENRVFIFKCSHPNKRYEMGLLSCPSVSLVKARSKAA